MLSVQPQRRARALLSLTTFTRGLTEEPQGATLRVLLHQLLDLDRVQATLPRDPVDLQSGVRRADVRVETRCRWPCTASGGTWDGSTPSSSATAFFGAPRSPRAGRRCSGPGCERRAGHRVVVDRGRPGLEPHRVGDHHRLAVGVDLGLPSWSPAWCTADRSGRTPRSLPFDLDDRAVRVAVEQRLRHTGHRQRVDDAEDDGEDQQGPDSDPELASRAGEIACH